MRDRRPEFPPRGNFENRIEVCDFQHPGYKFRCIHQFEVDTSCFSLLAQLQQHSQTAGINGVYPRQVEHDSADVRLRMHSVMQSHRFTVYDSSLQTQDSNIPQVPCLYFQHNQPPGLNSANTTGSGFVAFPFHILRRLSPDSVSTFLENFLRAFTFNTKLTFASLTLKVTTKPSKRFARCAR